MPFVLRRVEPACLSKGHAGHLESKCDDERQVIANLTLSGAIRQLASLVRLAAHIFEQLEQDGRTIQQRTLALRQRVQLLQARVDKHDPRTVPVPEGDLETFSEQHKETHYKSRKIDHLDKPEILNFFAKDSRPEVIESLYAAAAPAVTVPVIRIELEDSDLARLAALGATLRRRRQRQRLPALDIETRRPASLAHLREWLSDDEALDEVTSTVGPDNRLTNRVTSEGALHRLPSPEEKARVAAQVFTAELVTLDVTGKSFERMSQLRRSLTHVEYDTTAAATSDAPRKRGSRRKHKKRRNTIASDDKREIQLVVEHCEKLTRTTKDRSASRGSLRQRLNLVHLFRQSVLTTPSSKRSESAVASSDLSFEEGSVSVSMSATQTETDDASNASSSVQRLQALRATQTTTTTTNTLRPRRLGPDNTFLSGQTIQVGVEVHGREKDEPEVGPEEGSEPEEEAGSEAAKRDSVYEVIPSEREFGTLGTARPIFRGVKLRSAKETDGARSSSGNWSGSSSTRASLDSEVTSAGTNLSPPTRPRLNRTLSNRSLDFDSALSDCSQSPSKSSATPRPATNHRQEPRLPLSSKMAEERFHSPEVSESHVMSDTETSSIYSCDAEGYYTSFHIDSGLKTLKEEPSIQRSSVGSIQKLGTSGSSSGIVENEYELFGRGSTSTTTSSAGTVIMRERDREPSNRDKKSPPEPPPRNRDSVATVIHLNLDLETSEPATEKSQPEVTKQREEAANSQESGTDTPELATETENRFRLKTAINSSRIPALCVITPPPSDDESVRSASALEFHIQSAFLQQIGVKAVSNPQSEVPKTQTSQMESAVSNSQSNPTPRVDLTESAVSNLPSDMPIVIKGTVVKTVREGDLVSLSDLPKNEAEDQPFGSASSGENSRSSSLERRRVRQGARVTLDSEGKVVYSSDSLKRRKAARTTFEPGQHVNIKTPANTNVPSRTLTEGTNTTIQTEARAGISPPPYRPAPSVFRTQPDGSASSPTGSLVARSDSYRQANQDLLAGQFQRNDSYRQANLSLSVSDSRFRPLDASSKAPGANQRRVSAPVRVYTETLTTVRTPSPGPSINPNVNGRRVYGGPRIMVNPRNPYAIPRNGSSSSLNSTGSGYGFDVAQPQLQQNDTVRNVKPVRNVVRPPSNPQDRPSFYTSGSPGGYGSLSPPPRLSALPLATPGSSAFVREDFRYNSLPTRLKSDATVRKVRFTENTQQGTENQQRFLDSTQDFMDHPQRYASPQRHSDATQSVTDHPQRYAQSPQRLLDPTQGFSDHPQRYAESQQRYASPQRLTDSTRGFTEHPQRYAESPQRFTQSAQGFIDHPQRYASPQRLTDNVQGIPDHPQRYASPQRFADPTQGFTDSPQPYASPQRLTDNTQGFSDYPQRYASHQRLTDSPQRYAGSPQRLSLSAQGFTDHPQRYASPQRFAGNSHPDPDRNFRSLPTSGGDKSDKSPTGRDSPEEGGFLEFRNRKNPTQIRNLSPTPSSSSCSLDVSFTSSLNDPSEPKPTRSASRLSLDQIYSALHRFRRHSDSPSTHNPQSNRGSNSVQNTNPPPNRSFDFKPNQNPQLNRSFDSQFESNPQLNRGSNSVHGTNPQLTRSFDFKPNQNPQLGRSFDSASTHNPQFNRGLNSVHHANPQLNRSLDFKPSQNPHLNRVFDSASTHNPQLNRGSDSVQDTNLQLNCSFDSRFDTNPQPTRGFTPDLCSTPRQRNSWAPESSSALPKKQTSIQDFKRKLLLHTKPSGGSPRISAVEMLKPGIGTTPTPPPASPSTNEMSPRRTSRTNYISNRLLNRKYSSPRSDVLNSTIIEGKSEEELADSTENQRKLGSTTPIETSL